MQLLPSDLFLLSPTALSYVPSLLLQGVLVGYLLRLRHKPVPTWLLIGWMTALAVMISSQIVAYTLYMPLATWINWIGGIVPGLIAATMFIQFAYRYPRFTFPQESRRVLLLCILLIVGVMGLMLYEIMVTPGVVLYNFAQFTYDMVSEHNRQPFNSPNLFSLIHPLAYVWALCVWLRVAFHIATPAEAGAFPLRQCLRRLLRAFIHPQQRAMYTVRAFVLFMLLAPFLTLILDFEVLWGWLPAGSFAASFLVALFIFALIYINTSPQPSTMMVKVVGISLVTLLVMLGMLNRFTMDVWQASRAQQYKGEVAQIKAMVEAGQALLVPASVSYIVRRPAAEGLFSTHYELLFQATDQPLLQEFGTEDARFQRELAAGLVVAERAAFSQFPTLEPAALRGPIALGSMEDSPMFRGVFAEPAAHYWRYLFRVDDALYEVGYSYLEYRRLLHQTALPLLGLTGGATVLILLIFPLFFRASLIDPLNNLLAGVQRMDEGGLGRHVPVDVEDEIGSLTHAFNRMGDSLSLLTRDLQHEVGVRREAEAVALANAQRFRQLFDNTPIAIVEVVLAAPLPCIVAANRQAQLMYGWSAEEFGALSPNQLLAHEAEAVLRHMVERVQVGQIVTLETTSRRRDGSTFPVRLMAAPDQGNAQHTIFTAQDITIEKQRRSELTAIAQERRRIAGEMHDSLAQTLAGLRLRSKLWQRLLQSDPAQLHEEFDELRVVLDASITEVRRSIFALRPIQLEALGFYPAVHHFVRDFQHQYQLQVHFAPEGSEPSWPDYVEMNLFRVIQESLNNVAKHAQAKAVWITINYSEAGLLTITIKDDGRGFLLDGLPDLAQQGHLGIKQMRERVESMQGVLLVYSSPGAGTRLEITLPLVM